MPTRSPVTIHESAQESLPRKAMIVLRITSGLMIGAANM